LLLLLLLLLAQALLELKGRLLVEAALEEVVSLVAAHLDLLQVRLLPLLLARECLLSPGGGEMYKGLQACLRVWGQGRMAELT
jgi:hypothetical protein